MVSGRLADRRGPVPLILAGGAVCGAGCLALAAWMSLQSPAGASTRVAILAAALVCGVGNTLFAPAFQSIVPMLVTEEELPAALALNFAPTALARTIGPAAGSILIATFSPATALLVIGLVMWADTVSLGFVRRPGSDGEHDPDFRISSALQFVWRDRQLLALLGGVTAIAAGAEPMITLAPSIARHLAHGGVSAGWVTTSFGLGGLIGVIVHPLLAGRLAPVTQGSIAMVALAAVLPLVAATSSLGILTVALVAGGAAMVLASIGFSIAVVDRCPRSMLGRVMGLWVIAFAGSRPLAGLLLGVTADHVSLAAAIIGAAVVTAVVAIAVHLAVRRHMSATLGREHRSVRL